MAERDVECVVWYVLCVNGKIKGECVCVLCFLHLPSGHNSIPCPSKLAQSIIIPYLLTVRTVVLRTEVHHKFVTQELCGIAFVKMRTNSCGKVAFSLEATQYLSQSFRFLFRIGRFWTTAAKKGGHGKRRGCCLHRTENIGIKDLTKGYKKPKCLWSLPEFQHKSLIPHDAWACTATSVAVLFGSKLREAQWYRNAKRTGFTGTERFNR